MTLTLCAPPKAIMPGMCAHKTQKLRDAVDLRNRTFVQYDDEHQALSSLYYKLLEGHFGESWPINISF